VRVNHQHAHQVGCYAAADERPERDRRGRGGGDDALPAGHPISWGAITAGTVLQGLAYCYLRPVVLRLKD